MAKKGQKRHQKRLSSPANLKLPRKTAPWIVKPAPGPHPADECLPLSILVRDYLEFARTFREARKILSEGQVQVNGKTRKDPKFPIGLMDVVQIPEINGNWRLIFDRRGHLVPYEIPEKETKFKLCKVVGKNTVKNGRVQVSFHDGRTSIGGFEDTTPSNVVKLELPDGKILDQFSLEKGKPAFVTGGGNVGRLGVISKIGEEVPSTDMVGLDVGDESFLVPKNHVFVVGPKEPAISLPGWLDEFNA